MPHKKQKVQHYCDDRIEYLWIIEFALICGSWGKSFYHIQHQTVPATKPEDSFSTVLSHHDMYVR